MWRYVGYDFYNTCCSVHSLLLAGWLVFFPESPKFLIECGETDEALEVLKHIYQQNTGNSPADYPVQIIYVFKSNTPCHI